MNTLTNNNKIKNTTKNDHSEYLPIPKIKSTLKKNNNKKVYKKGKKKKYLDSIFNKSFIETYFKKKELKIKHQK